MRIATNYLLAPTESGYFKGEGRYLTVDPIAYPSNGDLVHVTITYGGASGDHGIGSYARLTREQAKRVYAELGRILNAE